MLPLPAHGTADQAEKWQRPRSPSRKKARRAPTSRQQSCGPCPRAFGCEVVGRAAEGERAVGDDLCEAELRSAQRCSGQVCESEVSTPLAAEAFRGSRLQGREPSGEGSTLTSTILSHPLSSKRRFSSLRSLCAMCRAERKPSAEATIAT